MLYGCVTLGKLSNLLRKHGFYIIHAQRLKMHGGSLRIMATQNKNEGIGSSVKEITAYEKKVSLFEPKTWVNFGKDIGRKINIVDQTLNNIKNNSRIWGYGAAGKATLWVNACNMDYLEAMVDASPLRAGKLMPGTHTPIVFPDKIKINPPDYIFVTAWNYAELIKSKEKWFNGTWITPLPDLKFF